GDVLHTGTTVIAFSSVEGTVYLIDASGNDVTGWPVRLPEVPSCPESPYATPPAVPCMDLHHNITRGSLASVVLADLDGDGKLEVIVAAFDGNVYVFN